MYYGEIKNCDIANGIGVRVSLFVSGCTNHCKNCFQPETWDFTYGQPFTQETEEKILTMLKPEHINGLSLLGGEPFEPANQKALLPFLQKVKDRFPQKTIWAYSGFTLEELWQKDSYANCAATTGILQLLDVLVDGRFEENLKDLSLRFRGSANQRLIDMEKTRRKKQIVLWKDWADTKTPSDF